MVESNPSRVVSFEFVQNLRHEFENKSLYKARQFFGGINEWYDDWPHFMGLWQSILVITSSVTICYRKKQSKILSKTTCKVH